MATTTAAVTLTSDLLSDALSVSASTTCMKAGTTADGLDQMEYGVVEIATGTAYDIICSTPTASKASKLYVKNHSTDETYYISVVLDAQAVGRLYGGDWLMMPVTGVDDQDIVATPSKDDAVVLEYVMFFEV